MKYILLIIAGLLFYLTGFQFMYGASWLPIIVFVYYFRQKKPWYNYLFHNRRNLCAKLLNIHDAWDGMSFYLEVFAALFAICALVGALLGGQILPKKVSTPIHSLIFPATYVVLDFTIGLSKLFGTFSSLAITQFEFPALMQITSVTGMAGVSFLIMWLASTMATLLIQKFDVQYHKRLLFIFSLGFFGSLFVGGLYYTISIPNEQTVKVAGVTVGHKTDYWEKLIDNQTPKSRAQSYSKELQMLNRELFEKSEKAAAFGAKIIFWSEANAVIFNENREEFIKKAQNLARKYNVYFAPAFLVLKYGTNTAENKVIMLDPEGKIAYEYEKTISWYASHSDGVIKTVKTPFGILGSVICFDADFPIFIRQAKDIDILLNPKFDTKRISPGHTYSGLFRAVENGFSMVSVVNKGTSMAVDYRGSVLAKQDFFTTSDKTLIADVPVRGRNTLYSLLGDWFVYLNALFLLFLGVASFRKM